MAGNTKQSRYLLDSSFVLAFLLPDERVGRVQEVFEAFAAGVNNFYSSSLLPYEVLNGLKVAVARKRITAAQAVDICDAFLAWDIHYESLHLGAVFELALQENLTVYDASYVWLAKQKHIPLLTLDQAMIHAARSKIKSK